MKKFDVEELEFSVVNILGQQALYTYLRIDKATVPEGIYYYALRHGDDDSFPAAVEKEVSIDYFGVVLLTRELQLGDNGYLPLTEDDFWYTGEVMTLAGFKQKPQPFSEGSALAAYLMLSFNMTIEEADTVFQYLTDHGYAIGDRDNKGLFLCNEWGEWKECPIDNVIDMVCKWNSASIQLTADKLEDPLDDMDTTELEERYHELLEDEKLLDGLFNRTSLGKKIEKLAEEIADDVIQNSTQPDELNKAVERAVGKIKKFRHQVKE